LKNIKRLQNKGVIMKEIIYLLSLVFILGIVVLYTQIGTELLEDNSPIKQEESQTKKVYQKYEMSNYR